MIGQFLVALRWKKIQKAITSVSYEARPRTLAVYLARLVKVNWVKRGYTVPVAEKIILHVRLSNPAKLVLLLRQILELMEKREYLDGLDEFPGVVREISLYDWLVDKDQRVIAPHVVTQELQKLVVAISKEITACHLSREDLYEYYQYRTQGFMEDAAEFLEAMLSLKLRK